MHSAMRSGAAQAVALLVAAAQAKEQQPMSWGLSIQVPAGTDPNEAVEAAADEYRQRSKPEDPVNEALATACGTAVALLNSGAVGDPQAHDYAISLNGHANPEHKPAPGWANDYISISVSQAGGPA